MRSFLLATCLILTACAGQSSIGKSPEGEVFLLRTGYTGILAGLTTYAELPDCDTNPQPCSEDSAVTAMQKADLTAKSALDAAETVVRNNPEVNATFAIAAAREAISAAEEILQTYQVGDE